MECAVLDYSPLVVDATNISKRKGTKTSSVCSLLDTIMDKTPECVETFRELDEYMSKFQGRKRRHAYSLASQTVKAEVSDTLATCIQKKKKSSRQEDMAAGHKHKQKSLWHKYTLVSGVHNQKCLQHKDTPSTCKHKQKCSQHENDTSSVISLESDDDDDDDEDEEDDDDDDDEVEIIDSDPKPHSGRSCMTDVIIDALHKREPETVIIDLCSPSVNSKCPTVTRKYVDREDEKMSSSKYTRSGRELKEYVSVLGDGYRNSSNRPHDVPSVSSCTASHSSVPFPFASASSACDSAVSSGVEKMQDCEVLFISDGKGGDTMNSATVCGNGSQEHCRSDVRRRLQAIDNRMDQTSAPSSSSYGSNLYNPHPDTVRMGLRPIVIDGSNVAMGHSNGRIFSCRGLQICIEYFLQRKHKVVAFVPQFRKSTFHSQDTGILDILEKQGLVTFTPSRKIGKQLVVPYDDRFIVQYAAECGGVIVSTDNYRDLLEENPAWRETIEKRLLMFTWVGDVLMFPQDPLGRHGPNLESFLRFP
jgi:ribonuclease ZC3H12